MFSLNSKILARLRGSYDENGDGELSMEEFRILVLL